MCPQVTSEEPLAQSGNRHGSFSGFFPSPPRTAASCAEYISGSTEIQFSEIQFSNVN
jgi:hypothetical protein